MQPVEKIWLDGELVAWEAATTHILTHTLHYGLGIFEGIRCYKTDRGPAIFRLQEHIDRLYQSAKITRMTIPYRPEELIEATFDLIRVNGLDECYIRPIAFLGYGRMGLNPIGLPVSVAVAVWPWGAYLGEEGLTKGIRAKISSFTRHHTNVTMTKAKVCGNYANSQLAKAEAIEHGYDEAIMLDPWGNVAEGSGENIFIVRHGELKTPPLMAILEGITRDSVIELARSMDISVREENFSRDELYVAEEAFFTGTAAEVTPIREVDGRTIGPGKPGHMTTKLQQLFFDVVAGRDPAHEHWLTYVPPA
ncbi:branched-chain amino acid transaminase [Nitrospinae bacterium AH_259_B05_G02_I21]|nr:branched-chain amino acid transaminase [Nitrospinae bacterium AH_259_B05_G02_I21]